MYPDELQRHEPERARDVVVGDGVLVALDRGEDEPVDGADRLQRGCDALGLGEVEGARLDRCSPVDRRRRRLAAASRVAARDHDLRRRGGIGLGEPQADAGRPSDDDDGSGFHGGHDRRDVQ